MNTTQLHPRFCFCTFFSFEINLFRRRECFHMVTYINSVVVWVSLSRRYVQMSCWRTDVRVKLEFNDVIIKD